MRIGRDSFRDADWGCWFGGCHCVGLREEADVFLVYLALEDLPSSHSLSGWCYCLFIIVVYVELLHVCLVKLFEILVRDCWEEHSS